MAAVTGNGGRTRQHDRRPAAHGNDTHRRRAPGPAACLAALLLPAVTAAADPTPLPLEGPSARRDYPHAERIEQVVTLDGFGRYAFEAAGEQPVRVQLVDRMAGPGRLRTGRTDRFLDRGRVKVVLHGQAEGTGDIRLTAHRFTEANGDALPRLPDQRLVETQLHDYQRRSYWIEVRSRRWVSIEAGGRYLADLRLWRDGRWLAATEPSRAVGAPVTGQPLEIRRIHARLEPGLYRLSAYGGPGNPWSTDTEDAPLYLRMGVPELPDEGWSVRRVSPFGVDRWRLRTTANVFQLSLPEARPARMQVAQQGDGHSPYQPRGGSEGATDKDARDPDVTVRTGGGSGQPREVLVTVEHAPGAEYRLAYLHHARRYALPRRAGKAWIGTVALGDPRDNIDATALVINDRPGRAPVVKAARAVALSSSKAWQRRFNLLDEVDLLVEIEEDGTYQAQVGADSEASLELQIEPLDRTAARNFRSRWNVATEARWDLVKGYYRVSMRPRHGDAGIARVSLHHAAAPLDSLSGPALPPRQASAVFEGINLSRDDYVLTNRYNYGRSGLTVRPWPLRLDRPLPVTQSADSVRAFQVNTGGSRTLIAETPDGERLPLALTADGPRRESLTINGRTSVYMANTGPQPLRYALRWQAAEPAATPALEAITESEVQRRLPDLPALSPGHEARLKLSRAQQRVYELPVDAPALYRLETTGLLSTSGRVRTRTVTDLAAAASNGVGRNFLIQRYLGSGDYRVSVNANGRSAGPLGLQLQRTPVREAGELGIEGAARTTVAPGEAVQYRLGIPEAGRYRLKARGLKQPFDIQLSGPDGWPVVRPGQRTPVTLTLCPGEHTLTVLPQSVEARAVLTPERLNTPNPALSGHGPHPLPLNRRRQHTWLEPDDPDAARTPDRWRFDLPAAMNVRFHLPVEMSAELARRADGEWQPTEALTGEARSRWRNLEPGAYRLHVRSRRPDNRLEYHVRVETRELPLGQSRRVTVPARVPFALDRNRLVKLSSLGGVDVAAALTGPRGEPIAFNDDRPDDWNFLISRQLPAGRYTLNITAPGGSGETTVSLDAPKQVMESARAPGTDIQITDGEVHVYPLTLPAADELPRFGLPLVFAGRSDGTHGVALERRAADRWETVTTRTGRTVRGGMVLTNDNHGNDYRLRIWALDTVPGGIRVGVGLGTDPSRTVALDDSLDWRLAGIGTVDAALGLAVTRAPGPLYTEHRGPLLWATPSGAFRDVREGWIPASGRAVWLLAPAQTENLRAEVVTLKAGTARTLPASPAGALPVRVDPGRPEQLRLWTAESTAQGPELRTGAASATPRTATAGGPRTAAVAVLPGVDLDNDRLRLRLAGDGPVVVSAHALAVGGEVRVDPGNTQITVPAGTAVRVAGPATPAHVTLAASARVAGILTADGTPAHMLWTGRHGAQLHAHTDAGTLWLANPGDGPETVSLGWNAVEQPRQLTPGRFLAFRPGFSGRLSLALDVPDDFAGRVHVAGAARGLHFVAADGRRVRPGKAGTFAVNAPGFLHIEHAGEPFGVWLADAGGAVTDWRHTQALTLQAPALLSLRGSRSALVAIRRPDGKAEYRWLDGAHGVDTLLPAGETRLSTTAGALRKTLTAPTAITDGLGEPLRLGPGEARAFTFTVDEERVVGVGLKADREVVRANLLDHEARHLGDGIVQMHRLEPGRYYLIAHLPGSEPPVLIRPALVGTQPPEEGPPMDVRERFRKLADEE